MSKPKTLSRVPDIESAEAPNSYQQVLALRDVHQPDFRFHSRPAEIDLFAVRVVAVQVSPLPAAEIGEDPFRSRAHIDGAQFSGAHELNLSTPCRIITVRVNFSSGGPQRRARWSSM